MKKYFLFLTLLTVSVILSGCIRTRVVINSDPPKAKVIFNDVYRGKTPIEIPIIYYWFYKIKIESEGYNSVEKIERFRAPIYFQIPFDLLMEAIPYPITKTYDRFYILEKTK